MRPQILYLDYTIEWIAGPDVIRQSCADATVGVKPEDIKIVIEFCIGRTGVPV